MKKVPLCSLGAKSTIAPKYDINVHDKFIQVAVDVPGISQEGSVYAIVLNVLPLILNLLEDGSICGGSIKFNVLINEHSTLVIAGTPSAWPT